MSESGYEYGYDSEKPVTKHDFNDKLKLADKACIDITKYLESTGYKVMNVEGDREYQKKDIDILIEKSGINLSVEIKGDSYYPKNFYIEEISNVNKNTPGCLLYTESDYIFYYFIKYKELYIIDTKEFQNWYKLNKDSGKLKEINTKIVTPVGGGYYQSYGRTLNIKILMKDLGSKAIKKVNLSKYLKE